MLVCCCALHENPANRQAGQQDETCRDRDPRTPRLWRRAAVSQQSPWQSKGEQEQLENDNLELSSQ
jgi:hypothetical protein